MRKNDQRDHKKNTRNQCNQKPCKNICKAARVLIRSFEIGFQLRGRKVRAMLLVGVLSSKANKEPKSPQVFS